MAYKNLTDLHMHTSSSFDGHYSAAEMCEAAVNAGLSVITFTDHFDVDFFEEHRLAERQVTSYEDVVSAQAAFADKLKVLVGIEVGQGTYEPELTKKSLEKYNYDFIIGSIHNLRKTPDFCELDYTNMTLDEVYGLLDKYFEEMHLLAKWNGFDTLAHLTYPLRYIMGNYGIKVDLKKYDGIVEEIFKTVINNGKALEINTSGLRQKIGVTMPTVDYVRRFKELGGELLTIGSDAHFTEHVGAGINEGFAIAKAAGFEYVTYFEKHKPVQVRIGK